MTILAHYSLFKDAEGADPKYQEAVPMDISDKDWMEKKGYIELRVNTKAGQIYLRFKLSELIAEAMGETAVMS
jgi:hypothetical protein